MLLIVGTIRSSILARSLNRSAIVTVLFDCSPNKKKRLSSFIIPATANFSQSMSTSVSDGTDVAGKVSW